MLSSIAKADWGLVVVRSREVKKLLCIELSHCSFNLDLSSWPFYRVWLRRLCNKYSYVQVTKSLLIACKCRGVNELYCNQSWYSCSCAIPTTSHGITIKLCACILKGVASFFCHWPFTRQRLKGPQGKVSWEMFTWGERRSFQTGSRNVWIIENGNRIYVWT